MLMCKTRFNEKLLPPSPLRHPCCMLARRYELQIPTSRLPIPRHPSLHRTVRLHVQTLRSGQGTTRQQAESLQRKHTSPSFRSRTAHNHSTTTAAGRAMAPFEDAMTAATSPGPQRVTAGLALFCGDASGPLYARCFGSTSVTPGAPAWPADGIVPIASCTKLVTSVAALQCVERGLLRLDDDAETLLPELREARVLTGFDADGKPILVRRREVITLRRLLTHSSGFGYGFMDEKLARAHAELGGTGAFAKRGVVSCGLSHCETFIRHLMW